MNTSTVREKNNTILECMLFRVVHDDRWRDLVMVLVEPVRNV